MRIAVTSDWHGYLIPDEMTPECDLMVVAGDIGLGERFDKYAPETLLVDLSDWIRAQSYPIVVVAGNHDFHTEILRALPWIYLEDNHAQIEGVKIWGTPWSNPFGYGWAFNMEESDQVDNLKNCPDDVDVLITHGPPFERCDLTNNQWTSPEHVGSKAVRARMEELPNLKLVATGHIHSGYGKEDIVINGSLVNESYKVTHKPYVVEV